MPLLAGTARGPNDAKGPASSALRSPGPKPQSTMGSSTTGVRPASAPASPAAASALASASVSIASALDSALASALGSAFTSCWPPPHSKPHRMEHCSRLFGMVGIPHPKTCLPKRNLRRPETKLTHQTPSLWSFGWCTCHFMIAVSGHHGLHRLCQTACAQPQQLATSGSQRSGCKIRGFEGAEGAACRAPWAAGAARGS